MLGLGFRAGSGLRVQGLGFKEVQDARFKGNPQNQDP